MKTHVFTLILDGVPEITPEISRRVFEAGCDDAGLGMIDGVAFLEFERRARSAEEAIFSAIENVHDAELEVARVETDELVTVPEIAKRTGRTKESVRLLILGRRGPGGFPPPVTGKQHRYSLWRWPEVCRWFEEYGARPIKAYRTLPSGEVHAINAVLECRRHVTRTELDRIWRRVGRRKRPSAK